MGGSREAARRMTCSNHLKQSAALRNYAEAGGCFAGTICVAINQPSTSTMSGASRQGTGLSGRFLLRILPYMGWWSVQGGILPRRCGALHYPKTATTPHYAGTEKSPRRMSEFYCPTRRFGLRPEDTDDVGPRGRAEGQTMAGVPDAMRRSRTRPATTCDAPCTTSRAFSQRQGRTRLTMPRRSGGYFRASERRPEFDEITDGTGLTIMTGELGVDITPAARMAAIGGPATLLRPVSWSPPTKRHEMSPPDSGTPLNNKFWGSPGSDHSGVVNFGMADGSVRAIAVTIDPSVFALLGSMADASPLEFD